MYTVKMDLIHMRLMLGSFTDSQWKGVYKQAYEFVIFPHPVLSPQILVLTQHQKPRPRWVD